MVYCPECGTETEDSASFCPECGANISGGPEDSEHNHEEATGWFGISGQVPGMKPGSKIRNSVLGFVYAIVIFAVLGAAFGSGDDTNPSATDGGNDVTTTDAPEQQLTPTTDAPEQQLTPTTDAPEQQLTHEVGETFTVGSGEQSVEYTVESVDTANIVGGGISEEEADGQFVVVELTMENVGQETFDVSDNHIKLVDSRDREYEPDSDALLAVEDPIIYEQLDPGISKTFTVVFDVPPDQQDRQLKVEPVGILSTADEHYVTLE